MGAMLESSGVDILRRNGAVAADQLKEALGDLLADVGAS